MKSLKFIWSLVRHLFKSAVYRIMIPLMAILFVYSIFTKEDLTLGIPFILFVLFGTLLRLAHMDLGHDR